MTISTRIRAVLVGCGGISGSWLRAVAGNDRVEIVGLVDLDEAKANKATQNFSLSDVLIGTDLKVMLKKTSPDCVFDCTVPEARPAVTIAALKHGCHVLCEKPLADSMANARKMVKAAQNAGRILAVMQNRRYNPNIHALCRFIELGTIGNVTTVHCDFFIGAHFGGFRDQMKHVLLLDMAIHTFDAVRFVTGEDPVSALCYEWNPRGSWYDYDASAVAVFEMTKGVVFSYRGSWCTEGLNTAWESEWRIIGEKGGVLWNGADGFRAQVVVGREGFIRTFKEVKVPREVEGKMLQGHAGVIDEFVDCLLKGGTPKTICTDNIKSLAMVHSAIESAEKGRKVKI